MTPDGGDNYFRDLCESLGFICIGVDSDLSVRFWNRQAAKQFQKSAGDMLGRSVLEILDEADRDTARVVFEQALQTHVPGELEVNYGDGPDRTTFVMIVSPITDAGGGYCGASVAMRDISNRKRLSRELSRSRRMASLGKMAEGVTHNFNNILAGMLTSIDYALPSDSPRELRRALRVLAEAVTRASRITMQLARFAKSQQENLEWVDLNELLAQFEAYIRREAQKSGVRLEVRIERLPPVLFEKQRVLPVLESIAQNALDATTGDGAITIDARAEGSKGVIRIADTGCGMTDEELDHLFEPFFTTKGGPGGAASENIGLGLAMVHGLVSDMDGTIVIASKVAQGTVVTITLPLHRNANGANASGVEGDDFPRTGT